MQSLDDQVRELLALAKRDGIQVAEVIQEARSAKDPETRPEFKRLLTMIRGGRVQGVLTWSINRLSRNELDHAHIAYLLRTGKLAFIRTIDRTYRPEDNALLLSIENGMATAFIQDLRRSTARGMLSRVQRGWHSGKAPLGYKNDPETREVHPDPERFDLVRKVWEAVLAGSTLKDVHALAVAQGLGPRSKSGHQTVSRSWFYSMFKNRFYLGEVRFNGVSYPGSHKPMVTPEEFEQVQRMLWDKHRTKLAARRRFLFTGLLRCSRCGCAIVGEEKRKVVAGQETSYIYYHCTGHRGCRRRSIREEELLRQGVERLSGINLTEATAAWIDDTLEESASLHVESDHAPVEQLERHIDQGKRRLKELAYMRMDGEISAAEHQALRDEVELLVAKAEEELHSRRKEASRVRQAVRQRLAAAMASADLGHEGPRSIVSKALACAGAQSLNIEKFELRLDPIFEKITAFEPLKDDSQKPKRGDPSPPNPVWYNFVSDLRTAATEMLNCGTC